MARRKNYFSFLDFNFTDGAIDLFHNTIRGSFEYDSLTDDVFEARVLTVPTPIVDDATSIQYTSTGLFQKYSFRARILGANSPHKFLEDPCLLDDATDDSSAGRIFSIIQNHTQVVISNQESDQLPKIGDTVRIKLSRTGNTYDIRKAKQYIGLVNSADGTAVIPSDRPDCLNLSNLFENYEFDDMGSMSDGERSWDGKYPDIDGPEVQRIYDLWVSMGGDEEVLTKCGGVGGYEPKDCLTKTVAGRSVTLHPDFFEKAERAMNAVMDQDFGESISMGSSKRTIKQQIQLRLGNQIGTLTDEQIVTEYSSKFDPPTAPLVLKKGTGSRHLYGLAIDFNGVLQTGGTKAAKLSNSAARQSKSFKWMKENVHKEGFFNTASEPWHWSADGG